MFKDDFIEKELQEIRSKDLYRTLKAIEEGTGSKVTIKGKELINFCSNDYLGLASHPKVIEKAIEVMKKFGVGAGASRLVSGNYNIHEQLEEDIARYEGTETAVVFPSGYMANIGTIQALVGKGDAVIIDRLNHASIVDGAKLSGAKLMVYPHKDMVQLEKILKKAQECRRILIITDHVFSMDGDVAPLDELLRLSESYGAMLMLDTAHSTGVLPLRINNMKPMTEVILMGTLSKAIGSLGGFVSGTHGLIDFLRNKARTFIYSTALPPAVTAASIASLEMIISDSSFKLALWENVEYFRRKLKAMALNTMDSETQIIPVFVGEAKTALKASEYLYDSGILLTAIRPPTVPDGTSRLRLSITAKHSKKDIDYLAEKLAEVKEKFLG